MLQLFKDPGLRLNAAETTFLTQQLRYVDTQTYKAIYAALQARSFVPTQPGIPDWARVYTWREMDEFGKAKIISNAADDLPRADVSKRETNKTIKTVGAAYGYDWEELRAAAAMGVNLDTDKANAARFAVETEVDRLLAYGDSTYGLEGLLTLSSTTAFTPSLKGAGGYTWGSLEAPNATGAEVAADLMGIATKGHTTSKGRILKFDILLPIEQYAYAAQAKISAFSDTTALAFALATSPFIASITPWWRCDAGSSNSALSIDTMIAYPKDPMFVSGLVTMEYMSLPAQQKNLEWVVPTMMKCGGVVSRHPYLVMKNDTAF